MRGYPPFRRKDSSSKRYVVHVEQICTVFMCSDDLSRLFVHSPRTHPSINVNILQKTASIGNWQSVISWMLINSEYPCHYLNTQNHFKWWNLKCGVCSQRTWIVFSFSPGIKEREKEFICIKIEHYFRDFFFFNNHFYLCHAILNLIPP